MWSYSDFSVGLPDAKTTRRVHANKFCTLIAHCLTSSFRPSGNLHRQMGLLVSPPFVLEEILAVERTLSVLKNYFPSRVLISGCFSVCYGEDTTKFVKLALPSPELALVLNGGCWETVCRSHNHAKQRRKCAASLSRPLFSCQTRLPLPQSLQCGSLKLVDF